MTPALQRDLFRIAQEALNNALKHAASSSIVVRLAVDGERATLTVCDDGAGFDPAAPSVRSRRLGITSMRERAEEAGGTFSITSQPGEGTRVNVEVPLA
jgi:signal transduction histidine kinase